MTAIATKQREGMKSDKIFIHYLSDQKLGFKLAVEIMESGTQEKKPTSCHLLDLAAAIFEDVGATDSPEYVDCLAHIAMTTDLTEAARDRFAQALRILTDHPWRGFGFGRVALFFSSWLYDHDDFAGCVRWFENACDFCVASGQYLNGLNPYSETGLDPYCKSLDALDRREDAAHWRKWQDEADVRGFVCAWESFRERQKENVTCTTK